MRDFEDTAGRLAEIDLSTPAVEQIVAANTQIQQAATNPDRLAGPRSMALLESISPVDDDSDEWKVCPDCGETIRDLARKCRFCDFRYDGDEPENTGVAAAGCSEAAGL